MNPELTSLLQFDLIIVSASILVCPLFLLAKTAGRQPAVK